jgi:hypothetical protein
MDGSRPRLRLRPRPCPPSQRLPPGDALLIFSSGRDLPAGTRRHHSQNAMQNPATLLCQPPALRIPHLDSTCGLTKALTDCRVRVVRCQHSRLPTQKLPHLKCLCASSCVQGTASRTPSFIGCCLDCAPPIHTLQRWCGWRHGHLPESGQRQQSILLPLKPVPVLPSGRPASSPRVSQQPALS